MQSASQTDGDRAAAGEKPLRAAALFCVTLYDKKPESRERCRMDEQQEKDRKENHKDLGAESGGVHSAGGRH